MFSILWVSWAVPPEHRNFDLPKAPMGLKSCSKLNKRKIEELRCGLLGSEAALQYAKAFPGPSQWCCGEQGTALPISPGIWELRPDHGNCHLNVHVT